MGSVENLARGRPVGKSPWSWGGVKEFGREETAEAYNHWRRQDRRRREERAEGLQRRELGREDRVQRVG